MTQNAVYILATYIYNAKKHHRLGKRLANKHHRPSNARCNICYEFGSISFSPKSNFLIANNFLSTSSNAWHDYSQREIEGIDNEACDVHTNYYK